MVKFESDEPKAVTNRKKHQISFEEARSLFFDEEQSSNEERFLMLGMSA
jgi:uncharacterized protein